MRVLTDETSNNDEMEMKEPLKWRGTLCTSALETWGANFAGAGKFSPVK
jgi:hypothetical protein